MIGLSESDNGTKMGVKETVRKMSEEFPEEVKAELEAIWKLIEEAGIDLCPKDTGALASTVKSTEDESEGAISASSSVSNDVFNRSLIAGDESVINQKTGKSTAEYAGWVHDGHMMRDGTFWEGVPFLVEALLIYESELEAAVDRAMQKIQEGTK